MEGKEGGVSVCRLALPHRNICLEGGNRCRGTVEKDGGSGSGDSGGLWFGEVPS